MFYIRDMNLKPTEMLEIARKRANLTQKEVAEKLGIDVSTYNRKLLKNLDSITLIQANIIEKSLPVKLSVNNNQVTVELK